MGEHLPGVLADGIVPAGDAPVIHDCPLINRIGFCNIGHGQFIQKESLLLSFHYNLPQQTELGTDRGQEIFVSFCNQLAAEQTAEQRDGNGVFNHQE